MRLAVLRTRAVACRYEQHDSTYTDIVNYKSEEKQPISMVAVFLALAAVAYVVAAGRPRRSWRRACLQLHLKSNTFRGTLLDFIR